MVGWDDTRSGVHFIVSFFWKYELIAIGSWVCWTKGNNSSSFPSERGGVDFDSEDYFPHHFGLLFSAFVEPFAILVDDKKIYNQEN